MSAAYIQVHFRLDFNMEANNRNTDQTVPLQTKSDMSPYCLRYWLPKNISSREEQTTNVVTGGKRVNEILRLRTDT